jgi:hypothetical protein
VESSGEQSVRLVHPICLLEQPVLDARSLDILAAGDYQPLGTALKGFLAIAVGELRGYVPAAICAPQAAEARGGEPDAASVIQEVTLYRAPEAGAQFSARSVVSKEEILRVLGHEGRFVRVQRADGQIGFVPETLCRIATVARDEQPIAQVVQAVALYGDPTPGGQLDSHWIVTPIERLLLLGREGHFALVQREDGRLGYVPWVLLGQSVTDSLIPVGPADVGWITVGGLWGVINWSGVAGLLSQPFLDTPLRPYLGLAVVLAVALLLWFASRRRVAARSFAVGVLLAYAFLHLVTQGSATLWL